MKFIASQVQINNLITLSLYQMLRNSEMCQLIIYDWRSPVLWPAGCCWAMWLRCWVMTVSCCGSLLISFSFFSFFLLFLYNVLFEGRHKVRLSVHVYLILLKINVRMLNQGTVHTVLSYK
jgi:hypothetical protein